MPGARSQTLVIGHRPRPNLVEAARLALRPRGLTGSRTHPVVSRTGLQGGKKLRERARPAGLRILGRRRDQLPRRLVLTPDQHHGRMRASLGEDLTSPVLHDPDL